MWYPTIEVPNNNNRLSLIRCVTSYLVGMRFFNAHTIPTLYPKGILYPL